MIEHLTQEQENSLPKYRDQWIDHGLDSSEIDEAAAIAAVNLTYAKGGMEGPKYFLFVDGPTEAMQFLSAARKVTLTEDDFDRLSKESTYALTEAIRSFVEPLENEKPSIHWPHIYGQHESAWLGIHQFFADHFGFSEQSEGLRQICKECGWVWVYADLAIISRKPVRRPTFNAQGQLHNEKQAAIEYADGTKVYAFNGVNIPEKWVLERETMDPEEILKCPDTDKRAAGIALFGYDRLKHKLDYTIVEGDPTTDIGALVEISIPGLPERGRFLEAICPRNGPVFLGVPKTNPWDDNKPITDAVGAQAFLGRLPRSAYEHPPIRT